MRILCIADGGAVEKIKAILSCYQNFLSTRDDITIDILPQDGSAAETTVYDRIVIDEHHFAQAAQIYADEHGCRDIYLWLFGTMIELKHPVMLDEVQKRYLHARNWEGVKHINKIKIEINRVLRNVILDTYPSQLQLESTSYCNARCIMCSHYYASNKGALDMDERMLGRLEELLPYLEVIIMHGNGEPLISKMFDTCVETYASYGIRMATNTNLSVLSDRQIDYINAAFANIRVSCDACTKVIYEGIRRGLSFEVLEENLARLRDRCPSVTKTMATVLMRQNLMQLSDLVHFAAKYGFEEIIFSNLGTSLIVGNENDSVIHYPHLASRQLRRALEQGKRDNIKVTMPTGFDLTLDDENVCEKELLQLNETPFFRSDSEIQDIREFAQSVIGDEYRLIEDLKDCYWDNDLFRCEGICEWCIEKPYIDLKGNVFVCCINATYRVGNLFDYDSFLDLWNNEVYKKIRTLFYQGKLPGFCDNCQFILNGSLQRLKVDDPGEDFYRRRRISKFYYDYCEEHGNER